MRTGISQKQHAVVAMVGLAGVVLLRVGWVLRSPRWDTVCPDRFLETQ